MSGLDARRAIVTGAGGMIGSAVARRLATLGATIAASDLAPPHEVVSAIEAAGGRAAADSLDVADPAAVTSYFDRTVAALGGLDILVTVAGVNSHGAIDGITVEEWDRVMSINLRGVFLCNQAAIAPMRREGYGRIVNIGSVLGKNGGNPRPWLDESEVARAGNAAYAAAKAGVHVLTIRMAKEMAKWGVTVNAVAPGPIQSRMTADLPKSIVDQIPVGRMGTDVDVATAVAFLCGEDAGFITGEILDVNGGLWPD